MYNNYPININMNVSYMHLNVSGFLAQLVRASHKKIDDLTDFTSLSDNIDPTLSFPCF